MRSGNLRIHIAYFWILDRCFWDIFPQVPTAENSPTLYLCICFSSLFHSPRSLISVPLESFPNRRQTRRQTCMEGILHTFQTEIRTPLLLVSRMVIYFNFFSFFFFLGRQVWHMKVPRLGVESELKLLAYTTTTATRNPSCVRPTPQLTAMLDP